ncbi:MAG TPA: hypothetical protein VJ650_12415 [Gemmatimonadaceae bacterium]|nr:hypothetical protein [Gemmatimonadaceae bacterium]
MRVCLTKRADGGAILKCVRDDGSVTWQRHDGRQAAFFPLHDLTHFAIESVLGIRSAFYGLIADGWDIEDTTGKGSRGPLPPEALAVELMVGAFDLERAGSAFWSATELDEHCRGPVRADGQRLPRPIAEDDLARIRVQIAELLGRWAALPVGGTLELTF